MTGSPARYRCLDIVKEGAIDWVTLSRPERLNALDKALIRELLDYFDALRFDHQVRVVVLRGAGKNFCAGLDLKEAKGRRASVDPSASMDLQRTLADLIVLMRRVPQPIVALVQGAASGGGFALALAADVRYAGRSARMNVAMARIGLTGCDIGISHHLTRAVGQSIASELMLTGRFINAERALRTGLVSELVADEDLEATGRELAQEMLRLTPISLYLTKEGVNFAIDSGSLEATIAMENRQQVLAANGPDFAEGIAAFLEKRPPKFGA
jgi:enoyl-CoA hydratase/carnithine racemase